MRVWYNGNTLAFQANDAGSIPATRSIYAPSQQLSIITTVSYYCCIVIFFLVQPSGWLLQFLKARSYSSAVEHSLGKGEVLSSILNMSSIYYSSVLYWLCSFDKAGHFNKVLYFTKHTYRYRNYRILKIINRVWQIMI